MVEPSTALPPRVSVCTKLVRVLLVGFWMLVLANTRYSPLSLRVTSPVPSVNENAVLPEEFVTYAQIPDDPAQLDSAEITANREAWITAWDEVVLR